MFTKKQKEWFEQTCFVGYLDKVLNNNGTEIYSSVAAHLIYHASFTNNKINYFQL